MMPGTLHTGATNDKLKLHTRQVNGTPAYLKSLLRSYSPALLLQSSDKNLLTLPWLSLTLLAKAYCIATPTVSNYILA